MGAAAGVAAPASRPQGLPGLGATWSRLVTAGDPHRVARTWHVLDSAPAGADLTVLCVHGNPTWSYLWRSVLALSSDEFGAQVRVVALDHLEMGYSERTGTAHRLADRIAELGCLTEALGITGEVVTVGHDWGGLISLGWALDHVPQLSGVVLTNTALGQPPGASVPPLLQAMRLPVTTGTATSRTSLFLDGTLGLAHPPLSTAVRRAYRSPYRTAQRRGGVREFVADIPLDASHPSFSTLRKLQGRLSDLGQTPALLLWGARDPVFSDRYLRDVQLRLPQARLHRFPAAGHLVVEDAPVAQAVAQFVTTLRSPGVKVTIPLRVAEPAGSAAKQPEQLWDALAGRRDDDTSALVEMGPSGTTSRTSWRELAQRVDAIAAGLARHGVRRGDRVGMLVPPGTTLTACVYACWRVGAVVVIADAGLGLAGLHRALSGARLQHLITVPRGAVAARVMGLRAAVVVAPDNSGVIRGVASRLPGTTSLHDIETDGRSATLPAPPTADDVAAVLFTSGATGPAKGVVYRHRQLLAQRRAVRDLLHITDSDRLVAAFAPFALYGPALGVASVVPYMDVTAPQTLTAAALFAAVDAIDATLVFAAPAALRNVLATASDEGAFRSKNVRALLSAGAPVPLDVLSACADLLGAKAHTPYGMTEVLPVTDITSRELADLPPGNGVCVGRPLASVDVEVCALRPDATPASDPTAAANVTGEIVVRAAHVKDHYDQLWLTETQSAQPVGWHRTGDVGHLDDDGRLWIEGRLSHVITTAGGPVTPVGGELALESLGDVVRAALVGVGPTKYQQIVAIVESATAKRWREASVAELDAMRAKLTVPVAAAFVVPHLPVDIRHSSKVDRRALARWAARVLAGNPTRLP